MIPYPWKKVLVTGSTGILGAYLVKLLLENSEASICCPVRAASITDANRRLRSSLEAYGPASLLSSPRDERLHCYPADLEDPNFEGCIEQVLGTSDPELIIHCGALTNLFAPAEKLERVNLGGTRSLIRLAQARGNIPLCFVSSYTVFGDALFKQGTDICEADLEVGQGFNRMPYQRSKYQAEKELWSAAEDGLPISIARAGNIFGESGTGNILRREETPSMLFYDALRTGLQYGLGFQSSLLFDVTPVDYIAQSILDLCAHKLWLRTFHLINPQRFTFGDLSQFLLKRGLIREILSFQDYRSRILRADFASAKQGLSYSLKALRYMLLANPELDLTTGVHIRCAETVRNLKELGIELPSTPESLLELYVTTEQNSGFLPAIGA